MYFVITLLPRSVIILLSALHNANTTILGNMLSPTMTVLVYIRDFNSMQ